MAQITIITREGGEANVGAQDGLSVMEIIRGANIYELLALCGGNCSCATCHVYVDPVYADRLPPVGNHEQDLLDCSAHRTAFSRLSCQIKFDSRLDGLKVTIAPED